MIDYAKWEEKRLSVTSLLLDQKNPRIPRADLEQRDLIAELVEHDGVYELAGEIVEKGYYPLESLIGLEQGSDTCILEGNRRLAALKLLISPDLAPENAVKKFRGLAKGADLDLIKKVRVLIAPSRRAAAPLIMQKHTRQQIARWSPLMQAKFYRNLENSGQGLEDLATEYGTTVGEIARFLRLDEMYQIACSMKVGAGARTVLDDPREFPAAVLQRLLDIPAARTFLGVEFESTGEVRGSVHPDEFRKGYTRIVNDIASGTIDTRTLNTVEDAEEYLGRIAADAPNAQRKGSFRAADLIDGSKTKTAPAPKQAKVKAAPRQSASVVPARTKCRVESRRIREVFDELRKLKVESYPNASVVLLRILLELSVGNYLDKTKKIKALLEAAKNKGKGPDWYPTLRQMLAEILKDPEIDILPLARKRLNKMVSQDDGPLSLDALDGFVHNRFMVPNARDLHGFWETLEGVFAVVLEEPAAPPKTQPAASPTLSLTGQKPAPRTGS